MCCLLTGSNPTTLGSGYYHWNTRVLFAHRLKSHNSGVRVLSLEYTCAVSSQAQIPQLWGQGTITEIHVCCLLTGSSPTTLGSGYYHCKTRVLFVHRLKSHNSGVRVPPLEYICVCRSLATSRKYSPFSHLR